MLSQTAEHALRAVLFLARVPDGRPVPADVIARALDAPANYLSKTLHLLAKAGVVEGVRGPSGGFRLVVPAAQLTVARVAEVFDDRESRRVCLLGGGTCDPAAPCDAHVKWLAVTQATREPLSTTTIADLLEGVEVRTLLLKRVV
jgi:Rrf2 family protein